MNIELTTFDENFLDFTWTWLNDPEIAENVSATITTKSEQISWFQKIKYKSDYLIWGIMLDESPIGVCGIKKITSIDGEYWGYIGDKKYWGNGFGKQMMVLMEFKSKELKLKSIWLQVNVNNTRAIRLYERMGYLTERFDDNKMIMRKKI